MKLAIRLLHSVAFGLSLLSAPVGVSSAFAQAEPVTVKAVMHTALRVLDPIASGLGISRFHGYMVFDTLLSLDAENRPQPQMASWSISDDKRTYTFTLRDGLKWHDGTDVKASDCVASLKRWAQRDSWGDKLMAAASKVEPLDDKRFIIELKEPLGYVLDVLSKDVAPVAFMMPERLANTPATEPITETIGSGPFKYNAAESKAGVITVYDKNPDYVPRDEALSGSAGGKRVNVDRVEWIVMPDANTSLNALLSGEVDLVEEVALDLLPIVRNHPDVDVHLLKRSGLVAFGRMNHIAGPFKDVKVRRAAMAAFYQQPFLSAQTNEPGFSRICGAVFGCDTQFATEKGAEALLKSEPNLDEAKRLLKESGYNGEEIRLLQVTDYYIMKTHPLVGAKLLSDAGFNVKLIPADWQSSFSMRSTYEQAENRIYDMFFSNLYGSDTFNPLTHPLIRANGRLAYGGYPTDPETEALLEKFSLTLDQGERKQIAEELQARVLDHVTYIPLGSFASPTVASKKLGGLNVGPMAPYFWGMTKSSD